MDGEAECHQPQRAGDSFVVWIPWRSGPEPVTITAVLEQYVQCDRVLVTSLSDPPLTMSEWKDRLLLLEREVNLTH